MWVWYFNESRWEQIPDREKDRLEPTIDGIRTGVMREPGRRWKFAQIQTVAKLFLFGGHRLWHGFCCYYLRRVDFFVSKTLWISLGISMKNNQF